MLLSCGIEVDECYTITWRESKYTLIHLPKTKRVRITAISKTMLKLKEKHGVIEGGVLGFDSIAYNAKNNDDNNSLESHPGFRFMIKALNEKRETLEWWMGCNDLLSNKKGLLWKHINDTDASSMSRAQLEKRVTEWGPLVKEYPTLKDLVGSLTNRLQQTEETLQETIVSRDNHFESGKRTFEMLQEKNKECEKLQREVTRLRSKYECS